MSAQQMVLAWQQPGLTPSQRLVLMDLADCADREGRNAFRAERTIAEHTQLALRTVKLAIKTLRGRGLLVVQELPTNRRSTTYELRLGGANAAPQGSTVGGANSASPTGAHSAPLGVQSRVQSRVQKSHFPQTPYKEDPVDPVDPAVVSLLSKAVQELWGNHPTLDGIPLASALTAWARARNLPNDLETVSRAIEFARRTKERSA